MPGHGPGERDGLPVLSMRSARLRLTLIALMLAIATAPAAKIKRSAKAVAMFKQAHHCPSTGLPRGRCPGWIVDHIVALKRGGADLPCNMQWQTVIEAKSKDRWE